MSHPILTFSKAASAIAASTGPAKPVQGTTGNGPLANPVTLSTTGPALNSGAGTGVIGSRLPQGGTNANPANEQPQPIDPGELDKAKLQAQQAQAQAQQAKAQQEMQKIEADHASKLRDMSGGVSTGFLQSHVSGLDSGLNKLLHTAMKSRLELGLAKRAAEGTLTIPEVPKAGTPAPTPAGYKPLTKTRSGQPITNPVTPQFVHDGNGFVTTRNYWEAQQQSRMNNLQAGNTANGQPRPGAFMQDMATHFHDNVLPALRGQAPITREIAPLGILDAKKDTSLAKWSPAWAWNRATTGVGNLIGSTIRGVGGHGVRAIAGGTDMVRHAPELWQGDFWNKPLNESPLAQSAWHTLKNVGGLYLDRFTAGKGVPAGALMTGGMTELEQRQHDQAQALALQQAADAQKMKAPAGQAPAQAAPDGNAIMEWLQQLAPFLAPYASTSWMQPHAAPPRGLPSQVGAGGHAVRDINSFFR